MSLRETKGAYEPYLMNKKNVVGVGEGHDRVVVLVTRKEELSALSTSDVVDRYLSDPVDESLYRTDVVEIGELHALSTDGLRPGASLGREGAGHVGTCGCLVERDGKLSILSNWHVLDAAAGTRVLHPSPMDGTAKYVGVITETVPPVFGSVNVMDAAVAEITAPGQVVGNDFITGGPVMVAVGDAVEKTGRTSGHTTGEVVALNTTIDVNYSSGVARFSGQIVTSTMLDPGDSGSVGVKDGSPFGLGFAGSDYSSIFTPIGVVFSKLRLQLPKEEESEPEPESESEAEPPEDTLLQRFIRWLQKFLGIR